MPVPLAAESPFKPRGRRKKASPAEDHAGEAASLPDDSVPPVNPEELSDHEK